MNELIGQVKHQHQRQTIWRSFTLAALQGFPPAPRFANSQALLEDASRRQYAELVSLALAGYSERVAIAVDNKLADEVVTLDGPRAERGANTQASPRELIIDLAELAGIDPEKMATLRTCDARGTYDVLSRELTIGLKTLRYPAACEAALRLAIDCALGSRRIDG